MFFSRPRTSLEEALPVVAHRPAAHRLTEPRARPLRLSSIAAPCVDRRYASSSLFQRRLASLKFQRRVSLARVIAFPWPPSVPQESSISFVATAFSHLPLTP